MEQKRHKAIVAGHICLDILPLFERKITSIHHVFKPGNLVQVGPVLKATGGAVPNTGLALHRLGVETALVGKIGGDSFGRDILDSINLESPSLTKTMIIDEQEHSSYTVIISPPGIDRIFLHHPGANRTFCSKDIDEHIYKDASLFHFGYPPFMESVVKNNGEEMKAILKAAKSHQLTTSLDMAKPDPNHTSGEVDWVAFLKKVLPYVDLFMPSIQELWYMLDPVRYDQVVREHGEEDIIYHVDAPLLHELSDKLISMGTAVVAIKLGSQGLYVRTSKDADRIWNMGKCAPTHLESWLDKEYLSPCFQVNVVGTTGAGDCAIAGFLTGIMNDWTLEEVLTFSVAVGAFNVEKADATSNIPAAEAVMKRIQDGWERTSTRLSLPGWKWVDHKRLYESEGFYHVHKNSVS